MAFSRIRVLLALGVAALGLSACGGGGGAQKTTVKHPSTTTVARNGPAGQQGLKVDLHGAGHHPVADKGWPVTVRVTHDGRPVDGTISYAFTYQGQVVARRSHYQFKNGHFHDTLNFPARAVGLPLAVQFVIDTPYGRQTVNYPITVKPARK